MANWSILKAAIADIIKTNGNQEITGQVLQGVLTNIVNALGERPDFAGVATPTTAPGIFDGPIFFIAATPGTYPSFSNIILAQGEIAILRYDENTWVKESLLEAATKADLAFVVNLGTFDRAGDAEALAASYADKRNVILMYFKISNVRSGFFLQSFSNTSATIQFYYLGGRRYVRQVSWGSGSIGSWVDVTGSERIQKLVYDEYNHTIKFKDALGDADWGGVQLPIASKENYIPGLVGTETLIDLERVKDRTLNEIPPYSGEIENADIVLQGTSTPSAIVYVKSKGLFAAKSGGIYYGDWPSTNLFPAQEVYNEGAGIGETYAIPRKLYYFQARDTSTLNSGLRYFDGSSFIHVQVFPQSPGDYAEAEDMLYIFRGKTVGSNSMSTDVVADVNIQTQANAVQIVSKPWGTNTWNVRAVIKPATSGAAGVMSNTQCRSLEELGSFLSKLKTAFGTTDLDTIVSKLATLK